MIAIITDSTAGFSREEALKYNIIVLPMTYTVGNHEYSEKYIDEVFDETVTAENILTCATAATNTQQYFHAFKTLTSRGFEVVCLTISARFSSAYTNAVTAKNMLNDSRISIIDSKLAAGGLFLLTMYASELVKAGVPADMIVEKLEDTRGEIGIALSVDDITVLRKSGRLGFVSQSIGTFLNLRPIFLCKRGTLISHSVVRGMKSQIKQLVNCIPQQAKKVVIHCKKDNPLLDELTEQVKSEFSNVELRDFSNVITVHVGYNTIGVAWTLV